MTSAATRTDGHAPGVLSDIRVLDVSGPIGHYAGRLLADLGADVIKVEPPEGDPSRRWGPFLPGVDAPEDALGFLLLNANKRGVTLDLQDAAGRDAFLRLMATADVLIESWRPSEAAAFGLTPEVLLEARPDLIHASVTGWGLTGPRAEWAFADIVALAMSGVMALAGFPDGPPEQLPDHQGYHAASIDAAAGIMAAVLHRDASGEGQHVEVSMQEALSMAQETAMQSADILGVDRERTGGAARALPGLGVYPTADGYIYAMCTGNAGSGFPGLVGLMRDLGGVEDLDEEPYASFIATSMNANFVLAAMQDPKKAEPLQEILGHMQEVVTRFFAAHRRQLLYEQGQERRVLLGMVSTPADISASPQLNARDWYVEVDDPGRGRRFRYPGPPWQLHGTPATVRRPAPLLGEHNGEVLGGLDGASVAGGTQRGETAQ
ncbi:MAG: hypothetical protein GEU80_10915 [Dehalococcoidia bacterium]|nr:hypothetical protein [Dehalococcoidia bacterium]